MQSINLLPPELRPKETTPLKIIITLYIGVALCFSLLMWALFLHLSEIPRVETQIAGVEKNLQDIASQVRYHDQLASDIKKLQKKDKIVTELKKERIRWGYRLDLLWDIVDKSRTTWVKSLSVSTETSKIQVGPSIRNTKEVHLPVLSLTLRSGDFEENGTDLQQNSEEIIEEFFGQCKNHEEFFDGFELLYDGQWSFTDKLFTDSGRLLLDYEVSFRAYPYDEDAGKRMPLK